MIGKCWETGLHYNWHRSYDPTLGRHTQADPLGFPDGPSRYAYAMNSPQVYVDPSGQFVPLAYAAYVGAGFALGAGLEYLTNPCATMTDLLIAGAFGAAGGGAGGRGLLLGAKSLTRVTGKEWSHFISRKTVNTFTRNGSWANRTLNARGGLNGNFVSPTRHFKHDNFRYPKGHGDWGRRYPNQFQKFDRLPDGAKGGAAGGALGAWLAGRQCSCR